MSMFEDAKFDLIIVGFVFYVVDRNLLLRAISEIDRLLSNNGHLIITDFFSGQPAKKKYHHIEKIEAYSFKQNYEAMFTASQLYFLLDKSAYNHNTLLHDSVDFDEMYSVSLLKKDMNVAY